MEENIKIKEELFYIYKNIKNNIQNDKILKRRINNIEDINSYNSITLINNIKDSIPLLINQRNQITNDNEANLNNNNNKILNDYIQLENQIKKLEIDNKYYIKNFFIYKIKKDSLQMKLDAYISLEDEFEELKEKVKYEGGKFLENDRKDNEIIILRNENSNLKKEIKKLERRNKDNENKTTEYKNKIRELQNNIENLNKKIYNLEKIIKVKDNEMKSNNNSNNNLYQNNSNSCINLRLKGNDTIINKKSNIYNSNNSLKNIIYLNGNNNNTNKRLENFHSPKNDIIFLENYKNKNKKNNNQKINTNLFTATYNKIINGINNRKIIIPVKNEFNLMKQQRNNSISAIRRRVEDKSKTIYLNKYNEDKTDKYYKSGTKNKNFSKLMNPKPNFISPLSCKNSKNNNQIIRKYIQKENNRNNSCQIIKMNSKEP